MDIITYSVRIKGTSAPALAIIQALGGDNPTIEKKRAVVARVLDELAEQADWALSQESPVLPAKRQELAQYVRALKRLDLTDPESVTIPEQPTIALADYLPESTDTVQDGAITQAQSIPGWASWNVTSANTWYTDHIVTPLSASLPATISATTNRAIIVALIEIMKDMGVMLWAIARMVIVLRNKQWPNLQE